MHTPQGPAIEIDWPSLAAVEREASRIAQLLQEIGTGNPVDPSQFKNDRIYGVSTDVVKADTESLCELCQQIEARNELSSYSLELQMWWREHKKLDLKRKEQEALESRRRNSMYQGSTPFTNEQLIFVIDSAMSAAFDRIEGSTPYVGLSLSEATLERTRHYRNACKDVIALFIPILWAQTEGVEVDDGMGCGDFYGWEIFNKMIDDYLSKVMVNNPPREFVPPSTRELAEKIVSEHWKVAIKSDTKRC